MSTDPDFRHTADLLVPVLYADLRRLARSARWQVSAGSTIQTTALVHEAYLRLRRSEGFNDHQHFLRAAAIAMRQILVNLARDVLAVKRGAGATKVSLDDAPELPEASAEALVEVSDALDRLAALSPRLAEIVECRFFGGYGDEETAEAMGLSDRTVRREWLKARAWLRRELGDGTALPEDGL
jgi:RNA polymerase sigma factor (TIGR02999 family)